MIILCKNCAGKFEYKGDLSAQIEYVKCNNVFKIVYAVKMLCPHCMNIIKPQSEGKQIVGIPIQEIVKDKRATDGTKISEANENTATRKSFLAKAFEEVKKNLKSQDEDTKQMKLEPIVDMTDETTGTKEKIFEIKKSRAIAKVIEPKKSTNGWHIKISKKHGKILKRFGFSFAVLGFSLFVASILPDLISSKSSYAVSNLVMSSQPSALVIDTNQPTKAMGEMDADVINLDDLNRLLERKTVTLPNIERNINEPLDNKTQSTENFQKLLANLNLSSGFGYRKDPLTHGKAFHSGIDIPRPYRAPIRAVVSGQVVFSGYKHGYGNVVILQHPNGVNTYYGHNAKNTVLVGDKIEKGEIIGYVGMTGRTTGPHLHFEVRKNNTPTNPIEFLRKIIKQSGKVTI